MRVWIDADACPRAARDQVVKFALKRGFEVVLVAGQAVARPNFACVKLIVVPSGPDAADDYLVEHGIQAETIHLDGAVESSVQLGVADAIATRNPTVAHDAIYLHLVYNRNMIAEGAQEQSK